MLGRHWSSLEEASTGKIWNNVSNKIISDELLNKI
jgi:hypothetical protein